MMGAKLIENCREVFCCVEMNNFNTGVPGNAWKFLMESSGDLGGFLCGVLDGLMASWEFSGWRLVFELISSRVDVG